MFELKIEKDGILRNLTEKEKEQIRNSFSKISYRDLAIAGLKKDLLKLFLNNVGIDDVPEGLAVVVMNKVSIRNFYGDDDESNVKDEIGAKRGGCRKEQGQI